MQGFSKQVFCLFDNWQEYNEKKKRNKLPLKTIDLLIPNHVTIDGWMCVYVCVDSTAHRWVQSVFHAQLQRLEGKDCSHSAYVLLRKFQFLKLFQFKAFSFIAFFSFQTFPWFSGLQSERQSSLTNKQTNKTALRSKFTGVWKLHKQWCPHRHWKYRLNEWIVFEHVCACVMFVLGLNIHHVYVF